MKWAVVHPESGKELEIDREVYDIDIKNGELVVKSRPGRTQVPEVPIPHRLLGGWEFCGYREPTNSNRKKSYTKVYYTSDRYPKAILILRTLNLSTVKINSEFRVVTEKSRYPAVLMEGQIRFILEDSPIWPGSA